MKPEEFINAINNVSALSYSVGIPVNKLPEYISQKEKRLNELRQQIDNVKTEKLKVLADHNLFIGTVLEYEANRPVAEKLTANRTGKSNKTEG